ncbi:hypothetical protein E4U61_001301 [Claviceps capensis]|nr:hypothetical protein E4U61_001301 [Claviceps capensis]
MSRLRPRRRRRTRTRNKDKVKVKATKTPARKDPRKSTHRSSTRPELAEIVDPDAVMSSHQAC